MCRDADKCCLCGVDPHSSCPPLCQCHPGASLQQAVLGVSFCLTLLLAYRDFYATVKLLAPMHIKCGQDIPLVLGWHVYPEYLPTWAMLQRLPRGFVSVSACMHYTNFLRTAAAHTYATRIVQPQVCYSPARITHVYLLRKPVLSQSCVDSLQLPYPGAWVPEKAMCF